MGDDPQSVYWFKVRDYDPIKEVDPLMDLSLVQLRAYFVVTRAIQRDKAEGKISASQVADRAHISRPRAQEALEFLVGQGLLLRAGRPGATPVYSLPFVFRSEKDSKTPPPSKTPKPVPTAEQVEDGKPVPAREQVEGTKEQVPVPAREHRPVPTAEQEPVPAREHTLRVLESLEFSESEELRKGGSSSSSGFQEPLEAPTAEEEEGALLLSKPKPNPPHQERWWTSKHIGIASEELTNLSATTEWLTKIDVPTVVSIFTHMLNMEDFRIWLATSTAIHHGARSWGKYVADAKHWPARREDAIGLLKLSVKAEPEKCGHGIARAMCMSCMDEQIENSFYCPRCGHDGIRQHPKDETLWEFCDCRHGQKKRASRPHLVDAINEGLLEMEAKDRPRTAASLLEETTIPG